MKIFQINPNRGLHRYTAVCISLCAALLWGTSCGEDTAKTPEVEYYLKVNPKSVDFQNTGGKRSVTVTTNIADWSFKVDDDSWVSVEATSGNVLELTAKPNSDDGDRMTYLRLTSAANPAENKVLEVKQGLTRLSVDPQEVEFDALGDIVVVSVETNVEDWEYSLEPSSAADWLTVTKTGYELQLTAAENPPGEGVRSASLIVKSEEFELEKTVAVTQREQEVILVVTPDEDIEFESDGGEATLNVTSNLDSWACTLDPEEAQDWLTVVRDGNNLTLTAAENPSFTSRSATLKIGIAGFDVEKTLTVSQKDQSIYLEIAEEAIAVKPRGETVTVVITTNDPDWSCAVEPAAAESWLTLVKDGKNLLLTATENTEAATRTATVKISAGEHEETIAVSQKTVPNYTQNITAAYLKNTGPTFTRLMDGDTPVLVPLPEGSTLSATRFYYITDWITNEAGRINGNWDSALGNRLCMSGINTGGNPPSQFRVDNGKIYQTVTLPAGRYRFDYHLWHKNNNSINVCLVVDVGNDLPDIGPWVASATQNLGDIPNALAYIEVPYSLNVAQGNPATVYELEFELEEETTVSMGFVANSRNQMLFAKFELWAE